jgi:hypothetical protein
MKHTYLVKRHGSNAANQSITPVMVLGWIEGSDRDDARRNALDRWTCYVNQHLELVPRSKAKRRDADEADRAEAIAADPDDPFAYDPPPVPERERSGPRRAAELTD